jgi:SSS family solute:Na+ symporter
MWHSVCGLVGWRMNLQPVVAQLVAGPLDYAVIGGYLLLVLGFGSYFARFSKSTKDFFFSGQRFRWPFLSFSLLATIVGSYSFVKYSGMGFRFGMSSSMTYLNDWFFMSLFMFGWLPIIYFARVRSIPEYLERRFNSTVRLVGAIVLIVYMLAYIAYNLYLLGTVAEQILGIEVMHAVFVIACVSAVYITAGGQTSVIFTDVLQGCMLLISGLLVFYLGLDYLGAGDGLFAGFKSFWSHLSLSDRLPFAGFNEPAEFNFVGVFWQDMSNSFAFFFINQGIMMRFLAARSMEEGRKVMLGNAFLLIPFAILAVGGAGWLGNAISSARPEVIDPGIDQKEAFVAVATVLCSPGVFGFVLATLIAAMMSTVDTLVNAVAAVTMVDIYQPYLAKGRSDRSYLRAARFFSFGAIVLGVSMVPLYLGFKSVYVAHATFTATVTPILAMPVFMGAFWKRFTPEAALAVLNTGIVAALVSYQYPQVIHPFLKLHGMDVDNVNYMRALFLLCVEGVVGVCVTYLSLPQPSRLIAGLSIDSISPARWFFKGGRPNDTPGKSVVRHWRVVEESSLMLEDSDWDRAFPVAVPDQQPLPDYPLVSLDVTGMETLGARPGDVLYINEAGSRTGLRSLHVRAGRVHGEGAVMLISENDTRSGLIRHGRRITIDKIL